jgi:glutathione S-transferase
MTLYDLAYVHEPWSVWADADRLARHNPLRRVPTLVLDDGTALVESFAILDFLDERAGDRALLPRSGVSRRDGLRACALATGIADKCVVLYYEYVLRKERDRSAVWVDRCTAQIRDTAALLERERGAQTSAYWLGERLGHADVAIACALRFLREAHPELAEAAIGPSLRALADRCEDLPVFREIQQPLTVSL